MNTQINITENGATTLATAGKYCDRNIDVNVSVPTHKEMIDSIITKTIAGDYVNNEVAQVGSYALAYSAVESVIFSNATQVNLGAFQNCASLKRAEFANLSKYAGINGSVFRNCTALEKIVLRGQVVCRLGATNVFNDSAIASGTGYIYVPDTLVDSYKTASNWATYANQIKPMSELEE